MSPKLKQQLRNAFRRRLRIEELEGRRLLAIVVNTTLDVNNGGDGLTTLREAIEQANSTGGPDEIVFDIPLEDPGFVSETGVWRIQPSSPLPAITERVDIRGFTQPSADAPNPVPNNVEINGFFVGNPLVFPTSYDTPNGFGTFSRGNYNYFDDTYNGIGDKQIDGSPLSEGLGDLTDGVIATSNWYVAEQGVGPYVGWYNTDPTITFHFSQVTDFSSVRIFFDDSDFGGVAAPSSVEVNGLSYDVIDPAGSDPFFVDLDLSGMSTDQLQITLVRNDDWVFASEFKFHSLASGPVVANGLVLAPGSDGSMILDLVINGFNNAGILVQSSGNIISGNFIGTDPTGSSAIPNKNGIEILADGVGVVVNGNIIVDNLISGNGGMIATVNAQTQPWEFNTDINLNTAFQFGIGDGLSPTIIDLANLGAQPGDLITVRDVRGSTDAFGDGSFVDSNGYDSDSGTIYGTLLTNGEIGSSELGFPSKFMTDDWDLYLNALVGTFADDLGNIVGQPFAIKDGFRDLEVPVGATRLQLGINDDIFNDNNGALQVVVSLAGLDGINDGNGVFIHGINGGAATGNALQRNQIGTDAGGMFAVGNTHDGVAIFENAYQNSVGGSNNLDLERFARNVIAGNYGHGVDIASFGSTGVGAAGNVVQGNWIGINQAGEGQVVIPNGLNGVLLNLGAHQNVIGTLADGGDDEFEGNVISGNGAAGVSINSQEGFDTRSNTVAGNLIGTGLDGFAAVPNASGVLLTGGTHDNKIGGLLPFEGNVLSGNTFEGVGIYSGGLDNDIVGNLIGTDRNGFFSIPNDVGVRFNGAFDLTSGNAISGNVISGNFYGVILFGSNVQDNVIQGNLIGTDINGDFAVPNFNDGIQILVGAHDNLIGGIVSVGPPGSAPGNVISGNGGNGIYIEASNFNTVQGNLIGVSTGESDDVFTTSIPNVQNGVYLLNSSYTLIGGPESGARNIISSNGQNGVLIQDSVPASFNTVQGNFIGVGLNSFELVFGNGANGVEIDNSDNNIVADNVISGNLQNGVYLSGYGAFDNEILGNHIGTDKTGEFNVGNHADGIRLDGAHDNIIGGIVADPGASPGNIIVGSSSGNGISVLNSFSSDDSEFPINNIIQGNLIGVSTYLSQESFQLKAIPNEIGVYVSNSRNTLVGGDEVGARNIISGNGFVGVYIIDPTPKTASFTVVKGNYVGTDISGTQDFGNGWNGVEVYNSDNNTIANNLLSGNGGNGVQVHTAAIGNLISGNTIGTTLSGNSALRNEQNGVDIAFASMTDVVGNQISGNRRNGVAVDGDPTGGSTSVTVRNNKIGTNKAGDAAVANGENGVAFAGTQNSVSDNLISGNTRNGVFLQRPNNTVKSNKIGTNAAGTGTIPNQGNGVELTGNAVDSVIGGLTSGDGNLISGNAGAGIIIDGRLNANRTTPPDIAVPVQVDTRAKIYGNSIVGNSGDGVKIFLGASLNSVGGTNPNAQNTISNNGRNGVTIGREASDPAIGNLVSRNSIFANFGLGIDLGNDGVTTNDDKDPDVGANQRQNKPVFTGSIGIGSVVGGSTQIRGTLNSTPNTSFTIEIFDNIVGGQNYLGSVTVTTDAVTGNANFLLPVTGNLAGRSLTATATLGTTASPATTPSTSEFSLAATVNEDVTARTSRTFSGFTTPAANRFNQTVTLRNTSPSDLNGPLYMLISGILPANSSLTAAFFGATALEVKTAANGAKYISIPLSVLNKLVAGATVQVRLQFTGRPTSYDVKILSGAGPV